MLKAVAALTLGHAQEAADAAEASRHGNLGVTLHQLGDPGPLAALEHDGLVETTAGPPFMRTVASCLDAYLKRDTARHAQAV